LLSLSRCLKAFAADSYRERLYLMLLRITANTTHSVLFNFMILLREGGEVLQLACLHVHVYVCPLAYLKSHMSKLHEIFCTYNLCPWLGPCRCITVNMLVTREQWRRKQFTRSSAIAEGPRDASCQLKSCQLPRNSAETTCTPIPEQIAVMKFEG